MQHSQMRQGPLASLKVVELGGVGPVPFCAMMLAGMGTDVVRIDRVGTFESGMPVERRYEFLMRGRRRKSENIHPRHYSIGASVLRKSQRCAPPVSSRTSHYTFRLRIVGNPWT